MMAFSILPIIHSLLSSFIPKVTKCLPPSSAKQTSWL